MMSFKKGQVTEVITLSSDEEVDHFMNNNTEEKCASVQPTLSKKSDSCNPKYVQSILTCAKNTLTITPVSADANQSAFKPQSNSKNDSFMNITISESKESHVVNGNKNPLPKKNNVMFNTSLNEVTSEKHFNQCQPKLCSNSEIKKNITSVLKHATLSKVQEIHNEAFQSKLSNTKNVLKRKSSEDSLDIQKKKCPDRNSYNILSVKNEFDLSLLKSESWLSHASAEQNSCAEHTTSKENSSFIATADDAVIIPTTTEGKSERSANIKTSDIAGNFNVTSLNKDSNSHKLLKKFTDFIFPKMTANDEEKQKIIKRLITNFTLCDPAYVNSCAFEKLVNDSIHEMTVNAEHTFVYVQDFLSELKQHKALSKKKVNSQKSSEVVVGVKLQPVSTCPNAFEGPSTSASTKLENQSAAGHVNESVEYKKERQIRKLEKLLVKLDRQIKNLEARELTLDDLDNDDSAYVREDLLKKRFAKCFNIVCKYRNCSNKADREIYKKFHYKGTKYPELNSQVEGLINKKRVFPDFNDIYSLVDNFCSETRLKLSSGHIHNLAKNVFTDVGEELKRRRNRDQEDVLNSYIINSSNISEVLPSEDEELKQRLDESAKKGAENLQQVFDEFVEKQYSCKEEELAEESGSQTNDSDENCDVVRLSSSSGDESPHVVEASSVDDKVLTDEAI